MRTTIRLAVLAALGLIATESFAAMCTLPASPTSSAYINAYNDGRVIPTMPATTTACLARTNFGTNARDTSGSCVVSTCAVTGLASEISSPETGYSLVVSQTRTIPTTTGGTGNIGSVLDIIWRKPAATAPATATDMCIIGTRVTMINADHDSTNAGTQYFEVNDVARGGYGTASADVGYFLQSTTASPAYRIGRTFTSVQHRAYKYAGTLSEKQNNGTNYLDLPTIGGSSTLAINGNDTVTNTGVAFTGSDIASASAAQQQAQVNSNWVDFTADTVFSDDDGATNASSAVMYVKAACNSDNSTTINANWVKAGAIRLRQTAQENTTFKEISISGYAPPGATVP